MSNCYNGYMVNNNITISRWVGIPWVCAPAVSTVTAVSSPFVSVSPTIRSETVLLGNKVLDKIYIFLIHYTYVCSGFVGVLFSNLPKNMLQEYVIGQ